MANFQGIINLTALVVAVVALVILNGQIGEKSRPVDLMLDLTATIAKGEVLSEQQQQNLKDLLKS